MKHLILVGLVACAPKPADSDPWGSDDPLVADPSRDAMDDYPPDLRGECATAGVVTFWHTERFLKRFTPPDWPFVLRSVSISQFEYADHGVTLDHPFRPSIVRAEAGQPPSAEPVFEGEGTWYPPGSGYYFSTLVLDPPVSLAEGESVFLSFALDAPGDDRSAGVLLCAGDPEPAGDQLYSDAAEGPFGWQDLTGFGVTQPILTVVSGEVAR
jgi:hypothetical protein